MSRIMAIVAGVTTLGLLAGCSPSTAEREAKDRARLELEETSRREAETANKAITEINRKRFGKRTPEEQAQHEAKRARQVQELLEAQKKVEADAAGKPPQP